jgi:hypothetical protein
LKNYTITKKFKGYRWYNGISRNAYKEVTIRHNVCACVAGKRESPKPGINTNQKNTKQWINLNTDTQLLQTIVSSSIL